MRFPLAPWSTICLLVLFGCAGCGEDEATVEANPFAGTQVTVSFPAGLGLEQNWELALAEWQKRTGAEVVLKPRTLAGDQSLIDAYGGNADSADLVLFPLTGISVLGDAGWFPVIAEQLRKPNHLNWNDLFQGLRDTIGARYGGPATVPISCPVLTCYYREDLLAAANLSPPRTWEEYQKLAETVDTWAGGLPVIEPWSEEFRATMYLARAVSYVKHPNEYTTFFDIRSGEPQINSPGFQRALEDSLKAVQAMPPEVLAYDTYDCRGEFFAGRAAMAITFETGFENPLPVLVPTAPRSSETVTPQPRAADIAIGFVRLPGSAEVFHHSKNEWLPGANDGINYVTLSGFGGMTAAVSARSSELETAAAWNLFEFLTSLEQMATTFPPATRTVCRTSQTSYPELWLPEDMTAAEGGSYLGEVANSLDNKAFVAALPVIDREKFRAALTAGLTTCLSNPESAEETLKTVSTRWKEIAEKLGMETLRDSYRRSLGLRPLRNLE